MGERAVSFAGSRGTLAGSLRMPVGIPRGTVLFAHCFTCGKDLRAARRIASALSASGFAVLRFDFTGLGASGGAFEDTTFVSNVADLTAAAAWLAGEGLAPDVLFGHSLGGAAVVAAAAQIPSVRGVVTLGAPFEPGHAIALLAPAREAIERDGVGEISLGGRRLRVGQALWDDLCTQKLDDAVRGLKRALLVLHSPVDTIVGVENARRMFEAARHPKSFVSLDRADHLLSDPKDADWVGGLVARWAERYVELPEVAPPPEGVVSVVTGAVGYRSEVQIGQHRWVADEPVAVGGEDTGPAPYDMLLAALGACTGMTLRMYADRKGLDLQEVRVELTHDKVHAKDCADCDTREGKVDVITRTITLEGDLDEASRKRLREIADRCPVHRSLHGEIKVRTT